MRLGTRFCQCAACGRTFGGVSGFELHRVGDHAIARRCMTDGELAKAGLTLNKRGMYALPFGSGKTRASCTQDDTASPHPSLT